MSQLLRRMRYVRRFRQQQDDLAEELAFHREMKARDLHERGLNVGEAADAARRALGNELAVRQHARDVWIAPRLQEIYQDIRFALRLLVRDRWFAVTAVLVLSLGIGMNNMMFSLFYTHTLRSLPIPAAERVLFISTLDERTPDRPLSYPELVELRTLSSFQGLAAYVAVPMNVGDDGRAPSRFEGVYATANALEVIGRAPIAGRAFLDSEDVAGAPLVAILGFNAWRLGYNGDPGIVGRTILVNGLPATVIGVLSRSSGLPINVDVLLPLHQMPDFARDKRDTRTLRVFGRLRNGVAEADARLEVEALIDRLTRTHSEMGRGVRARVIPINERFLGQPTHPAWLAFIAASLIVVVVSSANVANLMIARSTLRTRELAIRASLGAGRRRIVGQMLTESVVLAALGGAMGIAVSLAGVRLFRSAIPENTLPYWVDYSMDLRVVAALLSVAAATVLIFGLVPALQVSRTDVNSVLKDGGRSGTATGGTRRWTLAFLTAEFALTVVLLANATVTIRSRGPQVPSDTVVKTTELVTASVTLPAARYATPAQRADFYRRFGNRLRSVPGISGVSIASVLPRRGGAEGQLDVEDSVRADGEGAPEVLSVAVAPDYFETLALPLKRGRDFDGADGEPGREHAIVNERFVEMFLPDSDPIGRRISVTAPNSPSEQRTWFTIVGVAQDIRQRTTPTADPVAYVPLRGAPPATAALLVRSTMDTATLTNRLRDELLGLDPNLPLYRAMTMAKAIDEAEWNSRISATLILSITLIAIVLSMVGLYAVTAYAVRQRTQEIGIRMALGARPGHVRWFILRRAGLQVGIGLFIGILCTFAWNAAFTSERADIGFTDPGSLAIVGAVLAATVLLACVMPIRRATRRDPAVVLRLE
jgi:putative ABC transport system permease protein